MSATVIREAIVACLATVNGTGVYTHDWSGSGVARTGYAGSLDAKAPRLFVSSISTSTRDGRDSRRLTSQRIFRIQCWPLPLQPGDTPDNAERSLCAAELDMTNAVYSLFEEGGALRGGTYLYEGFTFDYNQASFYIEAAVTISE